MSFPPSTGREEEPIYVDYGDSDDDSDVIVIDTTPTILAEKISADSDYIQSAQIESSLPTKRQRSEEPSESKTHNASINKTTENENKNQMQSDDEDDQSFAVEKRTKDWRSKLSYGNVFEGCNIHEPIEIDDDSDDDGDGSNLGDGKLSAEACSVSKSATTYTEGSPFLCKKKIGEGTQSYREKSKTLDDDNSSTSGKLRSQTRNGKNTTTANDTKPSTDEIIPERSRKSDSEILTGASTKDGVHTRQAKNSQNAREFVGIDQDASTSQSAFEVIDLAYDDDDSSSQGQEAAVPVSNNESHQSSRRENTEAAGVEIIDVDEMEDIDFEPKHDKNFTTSTRKDRGNERSTKPRFKPTKNRKRRNDENFRDLLQCHREESRKRQMLNDLGQNKAFGNEQQRPRSTCPKRKSPPFEENRFVFHPSNCKPADHHSNFSWGMNIEDAQKEQERLLKQAANRVRNQPSFHVSSDEPTRSTNANRSITFSTVVRDVHLQYPDHFKYRDFYSRLGLPRNANESIIKSQFRRLALIYHPDRNIGKADTKHKFQAVTEAYNHLLQSN